MGETLIIDIGREALYTVLIVILPILGAGLIVGLLVAVFQATTQIQEQTLAFVPKIFAVLGAIAFFGVWIMNRVVGFTVDLFQNIPMYLGG
ncbi:MAG: flagellar biosynthesis protein FliQ [Halanaerobium sp.]